MDARFELFFGVPALRVMANRLKNAMPGEAVRFVTGLGSKLREPGMVPRQFVFGDLSYWKWIILWFLKSRKFPGFKDSASVRRDKMHHCRWR